MRRAETGCRFAGPIRHDGPLEVRMTMGEIADKTVTHACQIPKREKEESLAEGQLTVMIVSGRDFKPIQVPKGLQQVLNP